MIQFNLLPNVKLEYVKTQRTKRLLTLVSLAVSIASLAVLLLSFVTVDLVQKKSLHDLSNDITKKSSQLKSTKDLDKILTVQNQLGTLTSLHAAKPAATRLFSYISQVTPSDASLNKLTIDFTANTLSVGGKASALATISTYTDTLKSTMYTVAGSKTKTHAFSDVVLSSYSGGASSNGAATFTINFSFDPVIFTASDDVTLSVPATANPSQSNIFGGNN